MRGGPDTAAECQSTDPRMGHDTRGRRQPEHLSLAVQAAQRGPTFDPSNLPNRIDMNALHRGEIDHQAIIADGFAGNVVTAASHRNQQIELPGEFYHIDDIDASYLEFDRRRRIQSSLAAASMAAMETLSPLQKPSTDGSVIDATARIKRRRWQQEYRWKPSAKDFDQIILAIWP